MTHQTPAPLTDQQLNDIDARTQAATPGPWERYEDYGPYFHANTSGEYLRGVGDLNFGVGEQADADEAFVRHAQEDVTVLLAEVRRLQAQRKFLLDQLAKKDAASGEGDKALREFLAANPDEDEMAASLARDGFGKDEIANMLNPGTTPVEDLAAADNPTQLRWGLDDVMWGDDDSVIVLMSGPDREPYWLELDQERAAVLRQNLAGPDGEQPAVVVDVVGTNQ